MGPRFHKYEGLGNDFIVVDAPDERALSPEQAVALCDRHRGIGADGVLLVLPARGDAGDARALARMRVLNADGSTPEMCGNGVRCVALHLVRERKLGEGPVPVETDAGLRVCAVDSLSGVEGSADSARVTVDMGVIRVQGARSLREFDESAPDAPCTLADAGNPHAVLFGTFTRADIDRLGPRIATHPSFAHGTNVGFARMAEGADGGIDLVVWERGVGVTLACGTGACAAAAVACARGLVAVGTSVRVRLPGGPLEITIDAAGRATMRGPARHVFSGSFGAVNTG